MDVQLKVQSNVGVIGSVSDFAYKWSMNAGLTGEDAARVALAVDELVTDIVRFGLGDAGGEFDLAFHQREEGVEIIAREMGEPFDPDRHPYDPEWAVEVGNFEGAGLALIRHLMDDFVFINRGRDGKEFRMIKSRAPDPEELLSYGTITLEPEPEEPSTYTIFSLMASDAEDAAKLIYRTYGYTYVKEELYYPSKIAQAITDGDKFGVIVRTERGRAVGYFAVLRTTDSQIGEVGEVVVSEPHRQRGLMTMMLNALIEEARSRGLRGLFGEAVTVHPISQRVNYKLGFRSTALMLGVMPPARYQGLVEDVGQDISVVIDFLPLNGSAPRTVFLPPRYRDLLLAIYAALDWTVHEGVPHHDVLAPEVPVGHDVQHNEFPQFHHTVLVARRYGAGFEAHIRETALVARAAGMHVVYVDLPLDDPLTPDAADALAEQGFVLSGLMPLFHQERDYLRLQLLLQPLDLTRVHVYSELAERFKTVIAAELDGVRTLA